ncbi:MAG: DUF3592 domain-containing protein [Clostridiales bacterium]|nr:DUF3592 domain-containing protein [Clostridiales bacterium]
MDENKDTIQNDNKSSVEEMLLEVERRVAEKRGAPSESEARAEEQLREIKRRVGEIKRTHNGRYDDGEKKDKRPAIIILSIAFALFAACIGLFVWNIVKMRTYESDYVKMYGKVVDIKSHHSSDSGTYYYLVITYTYEGTEYTFTDDVGRKEFGHDDIGKRAQIYVNPQRPDEAVMVMSSGSTAIAYSCCFCFFCFAYAIGMMFLLGALGTSFLKRLCFVWGMIILLGIALFLLPWVGFPNSSFGEVFSRMDGAVGIIVVCGLAFLAMCADGAIMYAVHRCERGY